VVLAGAAAARSLICAVELAIRATDRGARARVRQRGLRVIVEVPLWPVLTTAARTRAHWNP
jgi:hypothetical protein